MVRTYLEEGLEIPPPCGSGSQQSQQQQQQIRKESISTPYICGLGDQDQDHSAFGITGSPGGGGGVFLLLLS